MRRRRIAEYRHEREPLRVVLDADSAPLVSTGAAVAPLRRDPRRTVSPPRQRGSAVCSPEHERTQRGQVALVLAHVEVGTDARLLAVLERLKDGEAGMQTTDIVAPRIADRNWRIVFLPRDHHQADRSLQINVHADPIAPRPLLSITGHAGVHEARIRRLQAGVVEPETAHDARAEVLDHHIGRGGEANCQVAALAGLEVNGERALGAVAAQIGSRAILTLLVPRLPCTRAEAVGAQAALHAHYIGAEIGKEPRAERPCQHVGKVQHPNASEWRQAIRGLFFFNDTATTE